MAPPIAERESETESFALVEMRGKRLKCLSKQDAWNVECKSGQKSMLWRVWLDFAGEKQFSLHRQAVERN